MGWAGQLAAAKDREGRYDLMRGPVCPLLRCSLFSRSATKCGAIIYSEGIAFFLNYLWIVSADVRTVLCFD